MRGDDQMPALRTEAMFAAQERVAELEALIAIHEFCLIEFDEGDREKRCPHCEWVGEHDNHFKGPCRWGQAAANHRARVEGGRAE